MEREKVKEREPGQQYRGEHYEETLRLSAALRERAKTGKIEIWSWCLIEKDLAERSKDASRKAYLQTFGVAGTTEQDDTETWADITQANRGPVARSGFFHYGMGLGTVEPLKDWPGPGTAYPTSWIEANERAMFKHWLELMTKT